MINKKKELNGKEETSGVGQFYAIDFYHSSHKAWSSFKSFTAKYRPSHNTLSFLLIPLHHSLWIMGNIKQVTALLTDFG